MGDRACMKNVRMSVSVVHVAIGGPSIFLSLLATQPGPLRVPAPLTPPTPTELSQIHQDTTKVQRAISPRQTAQTSGHFKTSLASRQVLTQWMHVIPLYTGTVRPRLKPAARRSSPTHPRSWRAPFVCPSRARFTHTCSYIILHHWSLYVTSSGVVS